MTPAVPGPPAAPARFGPWRREVRAALELLGLTGIAVAQPALDIVSKDVAGVFVTRDATALIRSIALARIKRRAPIFCSSKPR